MPTVDISTTLQSANAAQAHSGTNESGNAQEPTADELKQKNAALHQGMDQANIAKNKLETELAAAKAELEKAKAGVTKDDTKPEFLTKKDLWEYENRDKIAAAPEEYKKYTGLGIDPTLALRLALDDKGFRSDKALAEHMRQQQMSSAPSMIDRSGGSTEEKPEAQRIMDERMGISADDRKKYGPKVAEMLKGMSF